jgi:hypothetical protein
VQEHGVPLTVPDAKERLLLAILTAGAPGAVSFDALAESLWDGDPPATARTSLQVHAVKLRSSIEPDRPRGSTGRFVARRGPGYALTVPREAVVALRIDDLAARGRAQLTSGRLEEGRTVQRPCRLGLVVASARTSALAAGTPGVLRQRPRSARQQDEHHAEGRPSEDEQDHGDDTEHGGRDAQLSNGHAGTSSSTSK